MGGKGSPLPMGTGFCWGSPDPGTSFCWGSPTSTHGYRTKGNSRGTAWTYLAGPDAVGSTLTRTFGQCVPAKARWVQRLRPQQARAQQRLRPQEDLSTCWLI